MLTRLVPEYGVFRQLNASIYYPDVQARVFRIVRDTSRQIYSKQIASWTIANKVKLLYGKFDVDIRSTTEYRVVTAQQPPFIQLSGNPEKPYEGVCIDLLEEISKEVVGLRI
ncbi:unnamed protein product [Cylicocyclus nassatus]|uniref:Uncharacterized protein n=1 Tax=Cylicocyclus nassatus TaxID=53992 RepID=A0AA36H8I7_CYLNA|nr:unnamed protein product [Cylicocyclus nassatus]